MKTVLVDSVVGLEDVKKLIICQPASADVRQQMAMQIANLENEKTQLFSIEVARRKQINAILTPLKKRYQLEQLGYTSWIPLDPLTWRNAQTKLPVFALFDLHSDVVQLPENHLPDKLRRLYKDMDEYIARQNLKVNLSAKFEGTIPADTRAKIWAAVNSNAFVYDSFSLSSRERNCTYLLAEVKDWYSEPLIIKRNFIMVAWTEVFPDRLYYIDAFDIIPLENTIPIIP